jgi:hypothetical protein
MHVVRSRLSHGGQQPVHATLLLLRSCCAATVGARAPLLLARHVFNIHKTLVPSAQHILGKNYAANKWPCCPVGCSGVLRPGLTLQRRVKGHLEHVLKGAPIQQTAQRSMQAGVGVKCFNCHGQEQLDAEGPRRVEQPAEALLPELLIARHLGRFLDDGLEQHAGPTASWQLPCSCYVDYAAMHNRSHHLRAPRFLFQRACRDVRGQGHVFALDAVDDVAHASHSGCAYFSSHVGGEALGWEASQDVQQAGEEASLQPEAQLVTLPPVDGSSCGSQVRCKVWMAGVGQRSQDLSSSKESEICHTVCGGGGTTSGGSCGDVWTRCATS